VPLAHTVTKIFAVLKRIDIIVFSRPSVNAVAASLADNDDEHSVFYPLFCSGAFENGDEALLPWPMLSGLSSTSRPFVRPQPAPQAGGRGGCFLGYGKIICLLPPLGWHPQGHCCRHAVAAASSLGSSA
jgi:hypothetical protein